MRVSHFEEEWSELHPSLDEMDVVFLLHAVRCCEVQQDFLLGSRLFIEIQMNPLALRTMD